MLTFRQLFPLFESSPTSSRASHTKSPSESSSPLRRAMSLSLYEDLSMVNLLSKGKFPVYLVYSQIHKKYYAMKMFPSENGKPHENFKNEIRFASLNHPNVIRSIHVEHKKFISNKGSMSYILLEYAPYGDLFDVMAKIRICEDEKLLRTYFKQLIEGIEYLHNQEIAHMDLKLENLLVGENYTLKITDFDSSYIKGDRPLLYRGTPCYRAPEVIRGRCTDYQAADIYSAGVILFIMKSGGVMPHHENELIKGLNFFELLYSCNEVFWDEHSKFQEELSNPGFNSDFKDLFNAMVKYKPEERANLQQIKKSKWYNGPVYNNEELVKIMENYLG